MLVLLSLVTGPSFMPISWMVMELWKFSLVKDWPEIWKSEIPLPPFFPISGYSGELSIPNLARVFSIECYWILLITRVTAILNSNTSTCSDCFCDISVSSAFLFSTRNVLKFEEKPLDIRRAGNSIVKNFIYESILKLNILFLYVLIFLKVNESRYKQYLVTLHFFTLKKLWKSLRENKYCHN